MSVNTLKGQCHCGALSYQYHSPLPTDQIPVRSCGCTYCQGIGARYTSHPQARLVVEHGAEQMSRYRFGTATADFCVCTTCGGMPFVLSKINGKTYAVLNVNTLLEPLKETPGNAPANFDGEETRDRLARRSKNWIANVVFA